MTDDEQRDWSKRIAEELINEDESQATERLNNLVLEWFDGQRPLELSKLDQDDQGRLSLLVHQRAAEEQS